MSGGICPAFVSGTGSTIVLEGIIFASFNESGIVGAL